ncbi:MAG TPA: DUF4148 domain-containing protein [Burkholderiaceae bacterium]
MKMKTTLSLVAAAVALLSHSAFAQEKTREQRKAETAAAVKAGDTTAGEQGNKSQAGATAGSTKDRAARKSDTAKAVKAGETKTGDITPGSDKAAATGTSTKSRAERKSETAAAVKAGETKAGEQKK